eukprot:7678879-Prorocentrum_lima.AAC.1
MHPSMWMMIKELKPHHQIAKAEPIPPYPFAETHEWIKGAIKGMIALSVVWMICCRNRQDK